MNLFQNVLVVLIGFLLSEMLFSMKLHHQLIDRLVRRGSGGLKTLLAAFLLSSYFLSIVFSHTLVVIAMIPVVNSVLERMKNAPDKRLAGSYLYLSLTFGANAGSLASLSGSPQNLMTLALAEFFNFRGTELVSFLSWFAIGLPATLVLLGTGWCVIFISARASGAFSLPMDRHEFSGPERISRRSVFLLVFNISVVVILTVIQFVFRPEPSYYSLNIVDLCFLGYGAAAVFFAFILPVKDFSAGSFLRNTIQLLLVIMGFPLIFFHRLALELHRRTGAPPEYVAGFCGHALRSYADVVWKSIFREPFPGFDTRNGNARLSANLIVRDIPYIGLSIVFLIGAVLFFLVGAPVNLMVSASTGLPATWVRNALGIAMSLSADARWLNLFFLVILVMFASELLSNTALILIFAPLASLYSSQAGFSSLVLLLAVTIAASSAVMTPFATMANTLSYTGIEHISLKRVVIPGFFMNLASAGLTTITFLLLSKLLPP